MAHPDLYRAGNTTSPRYDNVRPQDIKVENNMVGPNSGGISTFSSKNKDWDANKTWVLQRTTPLVTGLKAINDRSNHWLIAPSQQMTLSAYKGHLTSLNSKAVRFDRLPKAFAAETAEVQVLAAQSGHSDRATRFLYNALASVVRDTVPVAGWDENDYEYIATLAREMEKDTVQLSELVWNAADGAGWSREKAFVADAVSAYMAHSAASMRALGNDDDEADAANDHQYLRAVLKLDDEKNPFSAANADSAV